jgi:hypothetical protein
MEIEADEFWSIKANRPVVEGQINKGDRNEKGSGFMD